MTSQSEHLTSPRRSWGATLLIGVVLLVVVFVFQWLGGAYQSEFGSHPDEAAHYVTGLVMHDYIAAGFPGNPLSYAKNYYNHYPKVALGHWPPFFYVLQSAWTLVFTPSRGSVLALMAVLTALTALILFRVLRPEFGAAKALAGAMLFLALPLVQQFAGAVMTEIPITLLILLATIFFGRYLKNEHTVDALAFGLLASLAILTKFSGFVLVLVPPLALLLTRKFHLLKRASFWWPVVIVAVLCGPWTAATLRLASDGMTQEGWGWAFTHKAVPFYLRKFYVALGAGVILLGVVGFGAKLFGKRSGESAHSGLWAAAGALLASVLLLHMVVPCGYEARHLIPALPAAVLFAVAGGDWLSGWLARRGLAPSTAVVVVFGVAALAFVAETFRVPQKGYQGFGPVAETLLRNPEAKKAAFLISSDARGEGMFIAEVAMREKRPGHWVRRGSKELASSSWSGAGYKSRFADEQSLIGFLRTNSVRYLVLDRSLGPGTHKDYHDLLERAVETDPTNFLLEDRFPIQRAGLWHTNGILLYRFHAD